MQTQDVPGEFFFKLWPWLEANKNRLIGGLVAIILLSGVWYYIQSQRAQKEVDAGEALTSLLMDSTANKDDSQMAGALEQLAAKYSGTAAGKRAQLQAAGAQFEAGNYPEAEAQFKKYLDANPTDPLAASAELGLGASLEAQNQLDAAAAAYQRVVSVFSASSSVQPAQFALGRIAEQQKKYTEAMNYYDDAAHTALGGTLAQEAAMRAADLKARIAATAAKPAAQAAPKPLVVPQPAAKP
jgi:predicted negative regulator of RcsB-dependent stress response